MFRILTPKTRVTIGPRLTAAIIPSTAEAHPDSKPSAGHLFVEHMAAPAGSVRLVANSVKPQKLRPVRVLEIVLEQRRFYSPVVNALLIVKNRVFPS